MMVDATVGKINEFARVIANKCGAPGEREFFKICPQETEKLYVLMIKREHPEYKPIHAEKAFYNALFESLQKYDVTVGDFMPFFCKVLKNRQIDELRKHKNRASENVSYNEPIDESNNENGTIGDTIKDESVDIEKETEQRNKVERIYLGAATLCIETKKNYSAKKRTCYPPLFFTDRMVYSVFDYDKWFCDIVRRHSNKFDEAIVCEFLNTLLTGECASVSDIEKFDCKPLSDFTEKQEDADKPCCSDVPNYHVFNCFLRKQNKEITQSAFSQHKTKFFVLMKTLTEEFKYD